MRGRARVRGGGDGGRPRLSILECLVSPEGRVTDVKVLRSIPLLDQAAIDAARQWVYEPTILNGIPVPVILTATANFRLETDVKNR